MECGGCGIHQIEMPWAREFSGFTLLMDEMIVTMAQSMQISEIASKIDEQDTRIWRVVDHYTNEARS